ncbi:MAG: RecX family transcriptional regulator [Candidatus Saccharibacteria bacterium]
MKITAISCQIKDKNRVNVSVDGKYRFSLAFYQLVDLGIKVGNDYDESKLIELEQESQFGKVYSRALEYCLMRPHSAKEVKDYLYRKTRPALTKTGEIRPGVSTEITDRVYNRLLDKRYIDDIKFAKYWAENRSLTKGVSSRKLFSELRSKGVDINIIDLTISENERNDSEEIKKVISKKRSRYPDDKKFTLYLSRLGFNYDEIKNALKGED